MLKYSDMYLIKNQICKKEGLSTPTNPVVPKLKIRLQVLDVHYGVNSNCGWWRYDNQVLHWWKQAVTNSYKLNVMQKPSLIYKT